MNMKAWAAAFVFLVGCAKAGAGGLPDADALTSKLSCKANQTRVDPRSAVFDVMSEFGITYGQKNWAWMTSMLKQGDMKAAPTKALPMMARASFEAEAALIEKGALVAALMIHDASMAIPEYARSPNAAAMKRFIVISVEPTSHPGDEEGEHQHEAAGPDRELAVIARRIGAVKAGLGPFYTDTSAKYYVRAHAYRDAVGILASSRVVCGEGLSSNQLSAISAGAEYVKTGKNTLKSTAAKGAK